jgi:hypothetical protein
MIYEYAVSPKLFSSEEHATFLYQAFGPDAGRLLCEFPRKRWLQFAVALIKADVPDGELQKRLLTAVTALAKIAVSRQGERWDDRLSWIDNAIVEHGRIPFRSILWEGPGRPHANTRTPSIALCDEVDWKAQSSIHVQRTAVEMVRPISDLLQLSRRVVLVDRNFNPADGRWVNVLLETARVLRGSPRQPKADHIVLILSNMNGISDQAFERLARDSIAPRLPAGLSVRFHLKMSNLLHARYVLTDIGGVQFADGLDEGVGTGVAPTMITRLSYCSHRIELEACERDVYRSFVIVRE